eukprot:TRINITY_DN59035_c0_g1_i1.p1 TRINITY_DN59035_c0_g1~~TRINITY_DN59035_c0_g1_i1.p1  ORF type:complete len:271 (+),score=26.61 TRINITY_DN59035_c0_g1_i1:55-813(+)
MAESGTSDGSWESSSDQGEQGSAEAGQRMKVDLVILSGEWAGLDDLDTKTYLNGDRRLRYQQMALAIQATLDKRASDVSEMTHVSSDGEGEQCGILKLAFGFFVGVAIFLDMNARITLTVVNFTLPPGHPCYEPLEFNLLYATVLLVDIPFVLFQIVCIRRDRILSKWYRSLQQDSRYFSMAGYFVYSYVMLGVLSGWQILRCVRQTRNKFYRDSFVAELDDPAMVSESDMRMPLYSTHLTVAMEGPSLSGS